MCWSVLQCVAVHCSVLQCVAMCRRCASENAASRAADTSYVYIYLHIPLMFSVLQCVGVCCSALQCVAVCCGV